MGKTIYFSDKDAERLYHLMRNALDGDDLSEEECDWYTKILNKLKA